MNNSLIKKYKPTTLKDLEHDKHLRLTIESWIANFNNLKYKEKVKGYDNKTVLIIKGYNGIGKSLFVDLLIKHLNYVKLTINYDAIKKIKKIKSQEIEEMIYSILKNPTEKINSEIKNYIIVIDSIEKITISKNKIITFITELLKFNKKKLLCPIIITIDVSHIKLIHTLAKKEFLVNYQKPNKSLINNIINKVIIGEKLIIEDEIYFKNKLFFYCQQDIRRLFILLQNFDKNINITNKSLDSMSIFNLKDFDDDIYESTNYMFSNYNNPTSILECYEKNRTSMPLMMQQNYIDYINTHDNTTDEKINIAKIVQKSFSYGDEIENNIREYQYWTEYESHGISSCLKPSFYLSKYIKKDPTKQFSAKYIKDFHKDSLRKTNKKIMSRVLKDIPKTNALEFLFMNKILEKMAQKNGEVLIKKKLESNGINSECLYFLTKLNKLNDDELNENNDLDTKEYSDIKKIKKKIKKMSD